MAETHQIYNETNPNDWIECEICHKRAKEIGIHVKIHNITGDEYKEKYNLKSLKSISMIDRVRGNKNPGYQHGGKFSAFSKNFIHLTDTSIEDAKESSRKTKRANPQNEQTKIEYYLAQGMTETDAAAALSKRQTTFSKEKCIAKYGKIEGTKRWADRQEKWQNTLNAKSDEEKSEINRKKMPNISNISKAEQEIYDVLKLSIPEIRQQIYVSKPDSIKWYHYDISVGMKIIEFNGDYWHCNPNKYKETDLFSRHGTYITAKSIWDYDKTKFETAINAGYQVLVIWEADYKKNKQETIDKCLNFLTT